MNAAFPLVSIVIPTYNRKDLFAESFRSAINQNYSCLEIIVVDDGSTDDTSSMKEILIREAKEKKVVVSWLLQKNSGVSSARNNGMTQCKGKYILFHDSDDLIDENRVSFQVSMLENLGADMCAASKIRIDGNKNFISKYSPPVNQGVLLSEIEIKRIHWGTVTFMYNRSILEGVWWDEKISSGEDKDFNFRVLKKKVKVCCESRAITYVREHNYDERLKYGKNSMEMYLAVHFKMIEYYRENNLEEMLAIEQARLLKTSFKMNSLGDKRLAHDIFKRLIPFSKGASKSIIENYFLSKKNARLFYMSREMNIKVYRIIKYFLGKK